jgi:hypothetical protein
MSKADKTKLGAIHGMLADTFEDVLKNGEVSIETDKETGERVPVKATVSPAMAAQIRQFLKDNHIEADITKRPSWVPRQRSPVRGLRGREPESPRPH